VQEPRFLTNDQGEPVEVVLDFDTYKKLLGSPTQDPKLLRDLSQEQLEALAASKLTTDTQAQLRSLIQREK
jgi:hypothetical protein